jgi:uncharacterized protein YjbI with pentapeptide repeats
MANPEHVRLVLAAWEKFQKLRRHDLDEPLELNGANLSGSGLDAADLRGADLRGADLSGADLSNADLRGANLSGAELSAADLRGADLSGADLSGPDLCWANLSGANLSGAKFGRASLREADLRRADLRGVELSEADLSDADLSGSDLSNADLSSADLTGVILTDAVLENANLEAADLTNAMLTRANLAGANLRSAILTGVTFADPDGNAAKLGGAILSGAVFTGVGQGDTHAGFLELSCVEGLESAKFDDERQLVNYVAEAFEYIHRADLKELQLWPKFVERAVARIRALRSLFGDTEETPAIVIQTIQAITAEIVAYLAKHPRELYDLNPRPFEKLICEILAGFGWEVQLTPSTRDGGYDMFAISRDLQAGVKTSWIIECKKYSAERKVGIDVVRGLYGVKQDLNVANILLATTSHFSSEVYKYKASRYDLELRDFEGIVDWLNAYRPHPEAKLYIQDRCLVLPSDQPIARPRGT